MKMQWMAALSSVSLILAASAGAQAAPPADANKAAQPLVAPTDDASIPQEAGTVPLGLYLPRTMAMLEASKHGDIQPIRVLFYGQSIVQQGLVQSTFLDAMRKAYPKANIIAVNNTIGGYTASHLVRTMAHDVVPARPDLIVFHDYDGEKDGNYEAMIRFMRANTAADILMWNHHLDNYGDVVDKNRERESEFRREISAKYHCEFADVRGVWKQYLKEHNLPRTALLRDKIHNTPAGCEIMGRILARHLVPNTQAKPTADVSMINLADEAKWNSNGLSVSGPWKPSADGKGIDLTGPNSKIELEFTGIRVDVIGPANAGAGSARILVDGKAPSAHPALWVTTRPSPAGISWFPGVDRVSPGEVAMVREDWKLHCFDVAPDGKTFKYRLIGSVTGDDGEGDSKTDFVSNSKRITIKASDFTLAGIHRTFKTDWPKECDITFKSYPLSLDEYQRAPGDAKADGARQTLLNGLSNEKHRLTIIADGKQPLPIQALVVYRPEFMPAEAKH